MPDIAPNVVREKEEPVNERTRTQPPLGDGPGRRSLARLGFPGRPGPVLRPGRDRRRPRPHRIQVIQRRSSPMSQIRHHPMAALGVLALGVFMTLLDLTIVNIAIPSILDGLHASLDQVLWVLNAYSLLYAVLLITSGRLGDILGPRNVFVAGVAIFTAASLVSGLAQNPTELILARGLQGLGAAILAPQGLPIMLELFTADRRAGVFAIYGTIAGLAVVAGPTLGGFIVTHFGWRWIFFVNLPIGLATFALALKLVPDLRPGRPHRLDLPGVLLATGGLLGLVFGLIEGQRYSWGAVAAGVTIPEIIGGGLALLAAFLVYQATRQGSEPLLPFAVFKDRNFTLMTVVMCGLGF